MVTEEEKSELNLSPFQERYNQIIDRFFDRAGFLFPMRSDTTTKILYHYTSMPSFKSIIQSNSLWMSNIPFLNDSLEIVHGQMMLDLAIKKEKYLDEGILNKEALDFLIKARALLYKLPIYSTYVTCFCQKGDLLSQWRGYGQGVAIGFDLARIVPDFVGQPRLEKVQYVDNLGAEIFKNLIDSFITGLLASLGRDDYEKLKRFLIDMFQVFAEAIFPVLKNGTFHEESEWRMIYHRPTPLPPDHSPIVDFYIRRDVPVPYVAIHPIGSKLLPIKEIVIGPGNNAVLVEKGVRELLSRYGYKDLAIWHSTIPFRS